MALNLESRKQGIWVLSVNRPPVNAFDWPAKDEMTGILGQLEQREDARVLVIRSELPRTFHAGSDIFELKEYIGRPGEGAARAWREHEMLDRMARLPVVTIAAIEGHTLGGGLEIALACDFRIAGANARLGFPEVNIGGAPGILSMAMLCWLVGPAKAKEILLFGESLSAEEAERIGLINRVVAAGTSEATAMEWASRLVKQPAQSVRTLKRMVDSGIRPTIDMVTGEVVGGTERLFQTQDFYEGVTAFIEKRTPSFKGR